MDEHDERHMKSKPIEDVLSQVERSIDDDDHELDEHHHEEHHRYAILAEVSGNVGALGRTAEATVAEYNDEKIDEIAEEHVGIEVFGNAVFGELEQLIKEIVQRMEERKVVGWLFRFLDKPVGRLIEIQLIQADGGGLVDLSLLVGRFAFAKLLVLQSQTVHLIFGHNVIVVALGRQTISVRLFIETRHHQVLIPQSE